MEEAITILRKRGPRAGAKRARSGRPHKGLITSYIHLGGKIGVLVEVNCETGLRRAHRGFSRISPRKSRCTSRPADPKWVRREEVPAEGRSRRRRRSNRAQMENTGKPAHVLDKIVEGKLGSFYSQFVLLDQPSIRGRQRHHRPADHSRPRRRLRKHSGEAIRSLQSRGYRTIVVRPARSFESFCAANGPTSPRTNRTIERYNSGSCPSVPVPLYKRVLLKLSGEALMGEQQFGVDPAVATQIAQDVGNIHALGVETAIVIGGGNIFRGTRRQRARNGSGDGRLHGYARDGHQRARAAGCARAARLGDARDHGDRDARRGRAVYPAPRNPSTRERNASSSSQAGTGNPYFTTDTAAALRAMEIKAEVILKGTKVDGVYTADPMLDPRRRSTLQFPTCKCSNGSSR
jgi:uridylate kinase